MVFQVLALEAASSWILFAPLEELVHFKEVFIKCLQLAGDPSSILREALIKSSKAFTREALLKACLEGNETSMSSQSPVSIEKLETKVLQVKTVFCAIFFLQKRVERFLHNVFTNL